MLAHLIGDLHQPLHVGSVYLDQTGHKVDPDTGKYDPATETVGGNSILDGNKKFHSEWDAIPNYSSDTVDAIIAEARAVPATNGSVDDWALAWASDTIVQSQKAFEHATFSPENADHQWHVTSLMLPPIWRRRTLRSGYNSLRREPTLLSF
ncbi:phospholipase C/S1-P1 nuclease domain-containing protein (plasmid) [Rhizobium sp. NXC14]|nr:phospholipase C/S1-P1 nuclease domain-containing protein [Rhizobium sp. NXC14]